MPYTKSWGLVEDLTFHCEFRLSYTVIASQSNFVTIKDLHNDPFSVVIFSLFYSWCWHSQGYRYR